MTYRIEGAVCPKTWKTIGRNGKTFTVVINNNDLEEESVFIIGLHNITIIKAGAIVDNGRKYKVKGDDTNKEGFDVESLRGATIYPTLSTSNIEEELTVNLKGKESWFQKLINWFK
jgi:hypothetical protein